MRVERPPRVSSYFIRRVEHALLYLRVDLARGVDERLDTLRPRRSHTPDGLSPAHLFDIRCRLRRSFHED